MVSGIKKDRRKQEKKLSTCSNASTPTPYLQFQFRVLSSRFHFCASVARSASIHRLNVRQKHSRRRRCLRTWTIIVVIIVMIHVVRIINNLVVATGSQRDGGAGRTAKDERTILTLFAIQASVFGIALISARLGDGVPL